MPSLGELWKLAKAVDDLVSLEKRNSEAFAQIDRRLDAIESRLTRMEADRERMISEAKAAAATAASVAASAHIAALAQALGGLEERVRQMGGAVLSGPRKRPRA